jgi:hypothetical protein
VPSNLQENWVRRYQLIEDIGDEEEDADCDDMCNNDRPTGNLVLLQNQDELAQT